MNQKKLFFIFLILLVLVLLFSFLKECNNENTFDSNQLNIDTSLVSKIEIIPENQKKKAFSLTKSNNQWAVVIGNQTKKADTTAIHSLLKMLSVLRTERLITDNPKQFADYSLADSNATPMIIHSGNSILKLFVGKMSMNPTTRQPMSFFRLDGKAQIFSSAGWLSSVVIRGSEAYRNGILAKIPVGQIQKIAFTYLSDSSFVLEKDGNYWKIGNKRVDSLQCSNFLNQFSWLNSREFSDKTPAIMQNPSPFKLTISGSGFNQFTISAFPVDNNNDKLIVSSFNSDENFLDGKSGLFQRIFVGKSHFALTPK